MALAAHASVTARQILQPDRPIQAELALVPRRADVALEPRFGELTELQEEELVVGELQDPALARQGSQAWLAPVAPL